MILDFDPEKHGAFVSTAFRLGSGRTFEDYHDMWDLGIRCAVEAWDEDPDLLMGFVLVGQRNTVVWAYTKPKARKRGTMRRLLKHLGVELDRVHPVQVHAPNHVAERMKRRGYNIRYSEVST